MWPQGMGRPPKMSSRFTNGHLKSSAKDVEQRASDRAFEIPNSNYKAQPSIKLDSAWGPSAPEATFELAGDSAPPLKQSSPFAAMHSRRMFSVSEESNS